MVFMRLVFARRRNRKFLQLEAGEEERRRIFVVVVVILKGRNNLGQEAFLFCFLLFCFAATISGEAAIVNERINETRM